MSWIDQVRAAFEYNEWANYKVLDATGKLTSEQLTGEPGGSRGALSDNLMHLVTTEMAWAAMISGTDLVPPQPEPNRGIAETLRELFGRSHARLREITAGLTEESLAEVVRMERGSETHGYPRWQLLLHVANHGTQHRAEIGVALLALDASPGDLDALDFFPDLGAED